MKKQITALILTAAAIMPASAEAPLWLRDVKISPDGSKIAFTYQDDIYTVASTGGKATRITTVDAFDSAPIWSPDGKKIAFKSDRNGGADIFIVDATGGQPVRLTFNSAFETPMAFTPDGKYIVYEAAIQDDPASAMFPTGRLTEVYKIPAEGGRPVQIISTPAQEISWLPDGQSFVYQDVKGMENAWRKHHTSSVTRDIWRYDAASGKHTNLTRHAGEDRSPVVGTDGTTLYFLSERDGGSFNVYSMALEGPAVPKALTDFKTHPVRFLSQGSNGLLAFTYDGEIYTMKPGEAPRKVNIDITLDQQEPVGRLYFSNDADEAEPSPDGKQLAYIYRGDVFVSSVDYSSTRQITSTPQAEADIAWSTDGKTLYYTSERSGRKSIYKAEAGHSDDPNFSNATTIVETPMFDSCEIDRARPMISPDGKKMAFIEDRSKIMVMNLADKTVKQITDGSNYPQRDGGFAVVWAPDSRWLATEYTGNHRDPYSDIAIIDTDTNELINLTGSGYFDMGPRWVMDGKAILFNSERYGMRNHASWGSMNDVMLLFLTKDAFDRYRLSEEDYALLKEVEKSQKKSKKDEPSSDKKSKKKKGSKKKDATADEEKPSNAIVIDREGLKDRFVRLTPVSFNIMDAILDGDGENLYFTASSEDGANLWKVALREGDISLVKKLSGGAGFAATEDPSVWFLIGDPVRKFNLDSEKLTSVSFSGDMKLDRAAEREAMFDFVVNEERERFYTPTMHGVDWQAMTDHYRKFLPHINNNTDFSVLLSELLGELNVSHTGSGAAARGASDPTASLGVLYDLSYQGPGLKVAEILEGGPFDRKTTALVAGSIITGINDVKFEENADPLTALNGLSGKKTLVNFTTPAGAEKSEVILPISSWRQNDMLYKRWVKGREHYVDSISGGRLAYIHLESMSDDTFREAYSNLLGRFNDREGVVIDTRWNGGGRLHEDIEVLFSGKKYFTQVVRGRETCDMPSRRWNKPSIMVQCEANYSNAHGTPWVYSHQGLGKLVGAPVPGTMTSVNWVTLQDPRVYFGIPVVGYRLPDGSYLENTQLEPDILVLNDPATVVKGDDAQLRVAVETLLHDIDAASK